MMNDSARAQLQQEILKKLREYYPVKVDENVLIKSVEDAHKEAGIEDIMQEINGLTEKGYIEKTVVTPPFMGLEVVRLKITSLGIEKLQSFEVKEVKVDTVMVRELEARLVSTYDKIKVDMEEVRHGLETSQKSLETDMKDMREKIADHDQVIRTYFVRVIETFGVFVGIFAIVVVMMLSVVPNLSNAPIERVLIYLIGVPLSLAFVILLMLFGIRKLILSAPT
jgi:Na+-transporting NADH:ubiquinone oxidoreductase subunit NqrD